MRSMKITGKTIKLVLVLLVLVILYVVSIKLLVKKEVAKLEKKLEVLEDTVIYLDGEQQVTRTMEGKKIRPLRYKNQLYIPITEMGYFLKDKEVEIHNDKIELNTVALSGNLGVFETETLYGDTFTNKSIKGNTFTVFLNWSTWCPYCIEGLTEIEKVYNEYKQEGIEFIGLLVDEDSQKAKELVEAKGITFKILKTNKHLRNRLQTNMLSIPEFVILNKEGEVVTDNISGEHNILYLKSILKELIIEECNTCGDK